MRFLRLSLITLLLASISWLTQPARAESESPPLTFEVVQGFSSAGDAVAAIPLDDGSVIAAGHFFSTLSIGPKNLISKGVYDVYVVRISPAGEVLWAVRGGGIDIEPAPALAMGTNGLGYLVGGLSQDGDLDDGFRVQGTEGSFTGFVAQFDLNGHFTWTVPVTSALPMKVTTTSDGSAVVLCSDRVIKISPTGELLWEVAASSGSLYQISSSAARGISVVGWMNEGSKLGDYLVEKTGTNIATLTDGGKVIGLLTAGLTFDSNDMALASTPDGGLVVVGSFSDSGEVGAFRLESRGHLDVALFKVDSFGRIEWARTFGGADEDRALAVASTSAGVVVGGFFGGLQPISTAEFGETTLTASGWGDGYLVGVDIDGQVHWVEQFEGEGSAFVTDIRANSHDVIAFSLAFCGTTQVGPAAITAPPACGGLVASARVDAEISSRMKEKVTARAEAAAKAKAEAEAKAKAEAEAKARAEAEAKAKAKSKAKKTITCVKGQSVKRVKGIDPKCPTGFKRR